MANIDQDGVLDLLRDVIDPELGFNIVDIGLIYGVELGPDSLSVRMTMTSPACPMGDMLYDEVRQTLLDALPEDWKIGVEVVWEPAWSPARMSPELRQRFGWQDDHQA